MIRLVNLCKSFGHGARRTIVADNLNVSFPSQRSVALLGRNGAGKSTLLRILAGTMTPDSGHVQTWGTVSWPVGFTGSFHGDLTGAQNVRFLARVYGVDTQALEDFVQAFAELGKHYRMPFKSYSSGMRSRLAFGVSMGIGFDTYLIDEVTSVGDAAFRQKSTEFLHARIQTSGAIVVSHGMGMLRRICDCAAVLEAGQLTFYNDLEEAISVHEARLLH